MKVTKSRKMFRGGSGKYEKAGYVDGKPEGMRNGGPVRGAGKAMKQQKVKYC
jgi:hypothetical protein